MVFVCSKCGEKAYEREDKMSQCQHDSEGRCIHKEWNEDPKLATYDVGRNMWVCERCKCPIATPWQAGIIDLSDPPDKDQPSPRKSLLSMFVLIGEYKGDYDDFYQRPMEVIVCSPLKEKLEEYWKSIEGHTEYIDHHIEEVPVV